MKTICYIVSSVDKAIAFEWVADHLDKKKFRLCFILMGKTNTLLFQELWKLQISVKEIPLSGKSGYPKAIYQTLLTLLSWKPDAVHTHLRDADLIGLLSARIAGIKTRITTRHSSTFNHLWFPKAVKWDRFINRQASTILAISDVVRSVLIEKENVLPNKIQLIHHGFDLSGFSNIDPTRIEAIKSKHSLPAHKTTIGIIARHIEWKGIQYIIPAIIKLQEERDDIHLILANASGPYHAEIQSLLETLIPGTYTQIQFEPDLFALYRCFDIYVHTPIDPNIEAFGQTYVEALASGIPSVFTLSGVAHEFIQHEENALVVHYKDSEAILLAILRLLNDEALRSNLIANGKESIKRFDLKPFIKKLEQLYDA